MPQKIDESQLSIYRVLADKLRSELANSPPDEGDIFYILDMFLFSFDAEKAAALNQNPAVLATVVRDGNSVNAGALLRTGTSDECIAFDTQFRSLDDMLALPLNAGGSCTTLGYAAEIGKSGRINDEIVRINGEECITVAVMSSSSGNSIAISRACRRALFNMQLPAGSWNILYDNGTVLESLAVSVVRALVTSFACVIIIIPFFFNSLRVLVLALLFLLVDSVWTVGLLNIAGMPVYRDAAGPIATPTSDEERTKFTEQTVTAQININAFAPEMPVEEAVEWMAALLKKYAHATDVETDVLGFRR